MHSSDTVVTPTWSNSSNPLARGVAQPLQRFLHREIAGGALLLIATIAALIWANIGHSYHDFWETEVDLSGLAPGTYMREEAAVVGTETCEYLARYNVDACFLGAAGLSEVGVTEAVDGFDAIKRVMMGQSGARHFLIDSSKFGRTHLARVASCAEIGTLVTDAPPASPLADAIPEAEVRILVTPPGKAAAGNRSLATLR